MGRLGLQAFEIQRVSHLCCGAEAAQLHSKAHGLGDFTRRAPALMSAAAEDWPPSWWREVTRSWLGPSVKLRSLRLTLRSGSGLPRNCVREEEPRFCLER